MVYNGGIMILSCNEVGGRRVSQAALGGPGGALGAYVPLVAALVVPTVGVVAGQAEVAVPGIEQSVNRQSHLSVSGRVNLGSFYTPAKYVALVAEWLLARGIGEGWTIADLSCGYGAFFELQEVPGLERCRYVGNDIDPEAVSAARRFFPGVQFLERNALAGVSREAFGFTAEECLIIVGNPPYNDVTSQINQGIKTKALPMDADVRTRDLGMSSLLAYDKLQAEYVAVLHPLSYLIKKSNFRVARRFFENYQLLEHVVFSSQEFAGTSKTAAFPVVVALYRRAPGEGLSYEQVCAMSFRTVEGRTFSLTGFDYVTDEVAKYPGHDRYEPEILFYTMRDINALKRSRTFIKERIANAVDVDPAKLAYYCYIDCFKRYAQVPYWMGNLNVPFCRETFAEIAEDVLADARFHHPEIFGEQPAPEAEAVLRIRRHIEAALRGNFNEEEP